MFWFLTFPLPALRVVLTVFAQEHADSIVDKVDGPNCVHEPLCLACSTISSLRVLLASLFLQ